MAHAWAMEGSCNWVWWGLAAWAANMAERLRAAGHEVIGYNRHPEASQVASLAELVAALAPPRVVWVMVPAEATEASSTKCRPVSPPATSSSTAATRVHLTTPGGPARRTRHRVRRRRCLRRHLGPRERLRPDGRRRRRARRDGCMPIFDALKPAGEFGFVHAGPVGAGHYAKMVHNGIEYGLMHAYAEGYELLQASEYVTDVPASSSRGGRAQSSGHGCSTCWTGRSMRIRSSPRCVATPRTPARAGGRSTRRSGWPCR